MLEWSTDSLRPRDRFEAWREERAKRLYGAEIELPAEWRPGFSGRLRGARFDQATIVDLDVTPYVLNRTDKAIDRVSSGSFSLWQVRRGGGLMVAGATEFRLQEGSVCSGWDDLPYSNIPLDRTPIACRVVKIPQTVLTEFGIRPTDLVPHSHIQAAGIETLFQVYLHNFFEQAPHFTETTVGHAVRALAQLALGTRGVIDTRGGSGATAVREALLVRACRLIEQRLHVAALSPTTIAGLLGISIRKLHLVFEPSGESFSRYVLRRRLARADQLLRDARHLSVSEVAYRSGFETLSTFFRCYRAAYGVSPGERRSQGQEPLDF